MNPPALPRYPGLKLDAPQAPGLPAVGASGGLGAFGNMLRQQQAYSRPEQRDVSRDAYRRALEGMMPMRPPGAAGFGGREPRMPGAAPMTFLPMPTFGGFQGFPPMPSFRTLPGVI